jgi:hypothetical protein
LHEAREQIVIVFLAFGFEDDELAAQAVRDSVLGRDGLTGRAGRTAALLSIAAISFEFAFGNGHRFEFAPFGKTGR